MSSFEENLMKRNKGRNQNDRAVREAALLSHMGLGFDNQCAPIPFGKVIAFLL